MSEENSKAQQEEVAYYSARITAWFNTKFERDKSLLTLSAGGIGILVTMISTTGIKSVEGLMLYIFALVFFMICLSAVLWIFNANATHLEQVHNQAEQTNEKLLNSLDLVAIISFGFAVLLSSLIGISIAIHSLNNQENNMTKETKNNKLNESVVDIKNMSPIVYIQQNSLNGVSVMKPIQSKSTPTDTTKK